MGKTDIKEDSFVYVLNALLCSTTKDIVH